MKQGAEHTTLRDTGAEFHCGRGDIVSPNNLHFFCQGFQDEVAQGGNDFQVLKFYDSTMVLKAELQSMKSSHTSVFLV